ncbi:chaplin [Streptomyces sp. A7024]|uniref:Chaplin n=1 Tax=Streptomyces coryli TaxID=1128680 RepID=A0A6G4U6A3_9ACTN|nr:chaplin [Streptomyces coryli]NGN66918.1 chaplin [Streptomyces coryli]
MRHVARKSLITVAAAGGVLAAASGYATADSGANGRTADSPGIGSGNLVQVPVNIPVNVCGNTVNVGGLLNPAEGNSCVNKGGAADQDGGGSSGNGGASADGAAHDSPGIGSGNVIQAPVDVPINVCGNSVTAVGAGNGTDGNECGNDAKPSPPKDHNPQPEEPGKPDTPDNPGKPKPPAKPDTPDSPDSPDDRTPAEPVTHESKPGGGELAQTGSDSGMLGVAVPAAGALLATGAVLYRRSRSAA